MGRTIEIEEDDLLKLFASVTKLEKYVNEVKKDVVDLLRRLAESGKYNTKINLPTLMAMLNQIVGFEHEFANALEYIRKIVQIMAERKE